MKKLRKEYNKLFKKLNKLNGRYDKDDEDNEMGHILQDKIYRKFVKDIVNNKFKNMTDVKEIAKDMNKYVVKEDKGRWYA